MDEADSFLGKRLSAVTQSADYGVYITRSVLLMEWEKFTGVGVFTTNLILFDLFALLGKKILSILSISLFVSETNNGRVAPFLIESSIITPLSVNNFGAFVLFATKDTS